MRSRLLLRNLLRNRRGNVLVSSALVLPLLVGFTGLATDTIQWTLDKRQLQRSADSAALAGAFALAQQKDATASANRDLERTNTLAYYTTPVIETPPSQGGYSGDNGAVRIALTTRRPLPFSSLFLSQAPVISVSSTAAMITNGNYCIIALDESANAGVTATGNARIDLNCGIFSNTNAANVVSAGGSAWVRSSVVGGVGGLSPSEAYVDGTPLLPYSNPQPDPFENLPQPNPSDCQGKITVNPTQSRTVTPGCYRGIDIKGTAHFEPGVYYVDGSSLSFGSQAIASGSGVTFVLTSTSASSQPSSIAQLDMNGGAQIDFSPPNTGTYEGVLIYQDRRAEPGHVNRINGNSNSNLEGAFYFANQEVEFNGNSGLTTDCVQLIAFRVSFSGNANVSNACPTNGAHAFQGTVVRLVE